MSQRVAEPRRGTLQPAAATARVAWPDRFGTRFVLCVDTEEEFDWQAPLRREASATTAIAAIPGAHRPFADRGVAVTYLVDYPVANDPRAVAALSEVLGDGRSEIGAQLHPWVNPPHEEAIGEANSFLANLPVGLQMAKLSALTQKIARAFGRGPRVFRAGRYGVGPATWELLARLGYRVDSSVRSRYDYSALGGPDFRGFDNAAFWADREQGLLSVPLTTIFTGRLRRDGARWFERLRAVPRGRGIAARTGLLSRVALTPEDMPIADALEAVRVALGEGERLLNFSFHSPSLVPGHTPYVRDAADLARFHRWWDAMLDLLERQGVRPASMAELIAAADAVR